MDDQQVWNLGMEKLAALRAQLSVEAGREVAQLLGRYQKAKEAISAVIAQVDAASDCRECRGQCCLNGKYRVSVLDALALIAADIQTPAVFHQKPVCPYGSTSGCCMAEGLRPADCVMFICDAIDRKLSQHDRSEIASLERGLRECINEVSHLTGEAMGIPMLLWAEKKMVD